MIDVTTRITERVNRARLALEARRSVRPLVISIVGIVFAISSGLYLASNVGKTSYVESREVSFVVPDAGGVIAGDRQPLLFKGIPAGTISDISYDGRRAIVTAKLESRFGPIYRDARAMLRPATALEDMFLDIVERGTPAAGEVTASRPLGPRRTQSSVQSEDVLDTFRPAVRANLGRMLRDLGDGLDGRGADLEAAFVEVVPFLRQAGELAEQIARHEDLTRSLVRSTSVLTAELARRQTQLRRLVTRGGATLRTLEAGSPGLDATLAELPRVMASISSSFAAVRGVLPSVDAALGALRPATDALPAGLGAAEDLAREAAPAVRALRSPVKRLVPLSGQLRPVAQGLERSVNALAPQIPGLDHAVTAVAGCATALQGFFQWTPSVLKFEDARGPSIRGDFAFGADSVTGVKDPSVQRNPSCAGGAAIGGTPGPGGDLTP